MAATAPAALSAADRLAIVDALMARYNAQDADGYAAFFAEQGCEANYRGAVLREGREGVRAGLTKMFAEFPENRADVLEKQAVGDYVVLNERVYRSNDAAPFDVVSIYSFEDGAIVRVEFVR